MNECAGGRIQGMEDTLCREKNMCKNMDDSENNYAKWKKHDILYYLILYVILFI